MSTAVKTALEHAIGSWPRHGCCVIAFSGGLDSSVLLHAMASMRSRLPGSLVAAHVDHALQPGSPGFAEYCLRMCDKLQVPCRSVRLEGRPGPGESIEAWARAARYQQLATFMAPGDVLVTAHQQDDQAETLLLQLLRGAGPAGLAAMPGIRPFGRGHLARPFLGVPRAELRRYAEEAHLEWIDDPSNDTTRHDRNYLRLEVMPVLARRWPGLGATLARAAGLQARCAGVLEELAGMDLASCRGGRAHRLRVGRLRTLSDERQAGVIRLWLGVLGLPLPGAAQLRELLVQASQARVDAEVMVAWPGVEVRRFAGELWAGPSRGLTDPRAFIDWRLAGPCVLAHGTLTAVEVRGRGLRRAALPGDTVGVKWRQGGEGLRPVGSRHRRELRKLFQEAGTPPWIRKRYPLLHVGDRLVAVPGLWTEEEFAASGSEAGWCIDWRDNAQPG